MAEFIEDCIRDISNEASSIVDAYEIVLEYGYGDKIKTTLDIDNLIKSYITNKDYDKANLLWNSFYPLVKDEHRCMYWVCTPQSSTILTRLCTINDIIDYLRRYNDE